MSGSHADSTQSQDVNSVNVTPDIPIEIVSEEEMALIDAALAAPRCCSPSSSSSLSFASQLQRNARFIHSISFLSKRSFSGRTESDIEDLGHLGMSQKRNIIAKSLLDRFRKNRALSVTDVTDTVSIPSVCVCGFFFFFQFLFAFWELGFFIALF